MRKPVSTLPVLVLGLLFGLLPPACGEAPAESSSAQEETAPNQDPPTARRDMLEDLRTAHRAPRHPSDGGGRAWVEGAEDETTVRAGQASTWVILYEVGAGGIAAGGFVRLTIPRFWNWSPAQTRSRRGPGFTTAEIEGEAGEATLEARDTPGFWVDFFVRGRDLAAGERLRITYGAGPRGANADSYAESDSRFWITVDGDGDGYGQVLKDSPGVRVDPGPPSLLQMVLPSTAEPGDTVRLRLSLLDAAGSAGCEFEGQVELAATQDGIEIPSPVTFEAEDRGVRSVEIEIAQAGVLRLLGHAEVDGRAILGQSNPLLIESDGAPILWADLHGHSNLSDGTGTPSEFLSYARDVAGLDVVSLTDHDHWGMLFLDDHPDLWADIQEATEQFHAPGEFVTILGYEWTNWIHGHRHVLYFEDQGEILSAIDPDYETPAQLWDALRGQPALTFAHHSAGGPVATNWLYPPDPELEPVTEVASVHGSSEAMDSPKRIYSPLPGNFVRDVLNNGYRLGFIGSGDSHDGHPGLPHLVNPAGGGMAALLTSEHTRRGVYEALRERRSYATNGPRIILRTALDANRMGSIVPADSLSETSVLYVRFIGTSPLERIDVVRSGEITTEIPGEGMWDLATTVELTGIQPGEYVYVRAVQEDRGAAWSSPIFVE